VIDVLSLGIDTPEHELVEATLDAYRKHDTQTDKDKVEQLIGEYQRDGLAVAGVPQTLAALSNGQVEELVIAASADVLQFDQAEVDKVLQLYASDNEISGVMDQRTVADELVRRATQLSSAEIIFIEDAGALKNVGGVGALLRYRVSAENAAPYELGNAVSRPEALVATNQITEGKNNVGQGSTEERSQAKRQGK
jgi:peptide subunit release factor 1 (eRF1)